VAAFVLAFDSGIAPAVGLQVTINGDNQDSAVANARIQLLVAQANAGNCDLVVKGIYRAEHRGFVYIGGGMLQPDRQSDAPLSWPQLIQAAKAGSELTFTGVPVGYGHRLGIDHNGNGKLDGDE
jgi:hypothetical protein